MKHIHHSMRTRVALLMTLSIIGLACKKEEPSPTASAIPPPVSSKENNEYVNWAHYLGSPGSDHFSPLAQINTENVGQLEVAWTYSSRDVDERNQSQVQCNPLMIDGVLYGTSAKLKAFALNAETGAEIWRFDPFEEGFSQFGWNVNRGLAFWTNGNEKRILYAVGSYLFALDANTGKIDPDFGSDGKVDLRKGLDTRKNFWRSVGNFFGSFSWTDLQNMRRLYSPNPYVVLTSPGVIYGDLIILGTRVIETKGAAPGHIRAYNIRTGKREWIFHTIPHPGEFGYETWPEESWVTVGGANNWAGMSLDTARGIVYVPTGSATFDFYGGDRKGENLFANSLIALDAKTGKRIWHFQTVHHDILDRDLPAPPTLVTIEKDGRKVEAVAQITKTGYIFVFDRTTGEPLFPIEERPIPTSRLKGEEAWPTQPVPTLPPPFARQKFAEEDITRRTPEAHDYVKRIWEKSLKGHVFMPPSEEGTIVFPGIDGGGEWGGAAVDEEGILYVNANEMPFILEMVPNVEVEGEQIIAAVGQAVYQSNCMICHGKSLEGSTSYSSPSLIGLDSRLTAEETSAVITQGRGTMPYFSNLEEKEVEALVAFLFQPELVTRKAVTGDRNLKLKEDSWESPWVFTGYNRFKDHEGFPAITPPWGTLTAVDLNKGEIRWRIPLGHHPGLPPATDTLSGTENYGGPVVTAGNLLFIAATMDEKIRAFDKRDGRLLWEFNLPAGGYATPSVYAVNGRQFVVIACGGGKLGTKSGDTYMAFALPEDD